MTSWKALWSGGFLAGKRTYILGVLAALSALASWAVGDASAGEMLKALAEAALGMGLITLRLGITANGRAERASGSAIGLEPAPIQPDPAPVNPDIGQIVVWSAFDKMKEQFGAWTSDAECETLAKRIAHGVEIRLGMAPTEGLSLHPSGAEDQAIIQFFQAFDIANGTHGPLVLNLWRQYNGAWAAHVQQRDRSLVDALDLSRTKTLRDATDQLRKLPGMPQ